METRRREKKCIGHIRVKLVRIPGKAEVGWRGELEDVLGNSLK